MKHPVDPEARGGFPTKHSSLFYIEGSEIEFEGEEKAKQMILKVTQNTHQTHRAFGW